jgi:catechol 2,3-dioxygenase-like lactoylglutathione lyase family enzyme
MTVGIPVYPCASSLHKGRDTANIVILYSSLFFPTHYPTKSNGAPMEPRISMITLGVRDLATAVTFYEEGLGFPKMESPPEVAFFTLNGTWLGLYSREALAEDAMVSATGSGFAGFSLSHNVATESEVQQVLEQAVAAGATLVKPAQKVFWGGYSGYFKDPDGHLWEVAHNPFFWVGPKDEGS